VDDAVRTAAADGGAGRHAHPARGVRPRKVTWEGEEFFKS